MPQRSDLAKVAVAIVSNALIRSQSQLLLQAVGVAWEDSNLRPPGYERKILENHKSLTESLLTMTATFTMPRSLSTILPCSSCVSIFSVRISVRFLVTRNATLFDEEDRQEEAVREDSIRASRFQHETRDQVVEAAIDVAFYKIGDNLLTSVVDSWLELQFRAGRVLMADLVDPSGDSAPKKSGGASTLDILLNTLISDPDPKARDSALRRLLKRAEIIARNLKGDGVSRDSASICMSVIADLANGSGKNAKGETIRFENEQAAIGYLRRCINNKISKEANRKRPVSAPFGSDDGEMDPGDDIEGGAHKLLTDEAMATRERVKRELDPIAQRIVELRESGGKDRPWDDIAAEVGLRPDNCRQVFHRYIKSVRAALNDGDLDTRQ